MSLIGWVLCAFHITVVTFVLEINPRLLVDINKVIKKLYPTLSICLIVQYVVVYTYLLVKIRHLNVKHKRQKKIGLLSPFLILTTFIIFKGIPDFIVLASSNVGKTVSGYFNLGTRLNIISDALIYVFMQASVKKQIARVSNRLTVMALNRTDANITVCRQINVST